MKKETQYVELHYIGRNLKIGRTAIVAVDCCNFELINQYKEAAIKKLIETKGYNPEDIYVHDWSFLGTEFELIK